MLVLLAVHHRQAGPGVGRFRLRFDNPFERLPRPSVILSGDPLPVVERQENGIERGQLFGRLVAYGRRHRSDQDALLVGDRGHDSIRQVVLNREQARGFEITIEGFRPHVRGRRRVHDLDAEAESRASPTDTAA